MLKSAMACLAAIASSLLVCSDSIAADCRCTEPLPPCANFANASPVFVSSRIALGEGQGLDLPAFVLPARLSERTIAGQVVWADGTPVAGATVTVSQADEMRVPVFTAETDANGSSSLRALDSVSYDVRATLFLVHARRHLETSASHVIASDAARPLKLAFTETRP